MNGKDPIHEDLHPKSGLGIGNVKKRLELLYPGKYDLQINDEPEVFVVNLRLELAAETSNENIEWRKESTKSMASSYVSVKNQ